MTAPALSPMGVFAVACGGVMLVSLDATIAVPIFPALRDAFAETSVQTLSWVLNAYTIVYAAVLAPAGRLSDVYGARRLFLFGGIVFTVASALCGLAPGPVSLSGARALQALGGALMTPSALALVLGGFPAGRRAAMVGAFSAAGALAAALGPAIGAALVALGGWRLAMLANVPLGAAVVWLVWRRLQIPAEPRASGRLDVPGVILLVAGMALLTAAVVRAEAGIDAAAQVVVLALLGVGAMLTYGLYARGRPDAAIDLALFRIPDYTRASVATFVFGIAFGMLFLHSYLFLIEVWGFSPTLAGLAVIPGPLSVIPTVMLVGTWFPMVTQRQSAIAGATLLAATQVFIALVVTETASYWSLLFPIQVLGGIAVGLVLPSLTALSVAHLPGGRFGVGGAVNNAVRQFGGVIGTALAVIMLGAAGVGLDRFQISWIVMASLSLCVALIALRFARPLREARPA
jgi:EmrB/QacA subfamily drug resistance transporter